MKQKQACSSMHTIRPARNLSKPLRDSSPPAEKHCRLPSQARVLDFGWAILQVLGQAESVRFLTKMRLMSLLVEAEHGTLNTAGDAAWQEIRSSRKVWRFSFTFRVCHPRQQFAKSVARLCTLAFCSNGRAQDLALVWVWSEPEPGESGTPTGRGKLRPGCDGLRLTPHTNTQAMA